MYPQARAARARAVVVDGRTVLVVAVPEGLGQVYGVEGHYVAREGSHRRALTPEEIRALLSRRGLFAYDREPVPGAPPRRTSTTRAVRAYAARFRSGEEMGAGRAPGRTGTPGAARGRPDGPAGALGRRHPAAGQRPAALLPAGPRRRGAVRRARRWASAS